jgi:hypothetical protein
VSEQPGKAMSKKHRSDHHRNKPSNKPPTIPTDSPRENSKENHDYTKRKFEVAPLENKKWGMTVSERIMAVLTTAAVLIALATGLVVYFQWGEMKTDQRAWVGFGEIKNFDFKADKPFLVTIPVENVGKTPAKNVASGFTLVASPKGDIPNFDRAVDPLMGPPAALLLPSQIHDMTSHIRTATTTQDDPLPQTEFDKLNSGEVVVYAIGKVTYTDIFDLPHWTKVCYTNEKMTPSEKMQFRLCRAPYTEIDPEEQ